MFDNRSLEEIADVLSIDCFDCTEELGFPVRLKISCLEDYKLKAVKIKAFNKAHDNCSHNKEKGVWDVETFNAQPKVEYATKVAADHMVQLLRGRKDYRQIDHEAKAVKMMLLDKLRDQYKPLEFFTEQCNA